MSTAHLLYSTQRDSVTGWIFIFKVWNSSFLNERWCFSQFLLRISSITFCLLLCNCLLIAKVPPLTLFRELVPAFWKPPVTLKFVQKAALDPEKDYVHVQHCRPTELYRQLTNQSEGKPKQKFVADFETIFKSVLKKQQNLTFIFPLKKAG